MGASVNSPAKDMRAIGRIAKAFILSVYAMGVSVKENTIKRKECHI